MAKTYIDKLTSNTLDVKIIQKNLVNKYDLNDNIKTLGTKQEIETLAAKAELKAEQDKIANLQTYDLSFLFAKVTLTMMEHNFT